MVDLATTILALAGSPSVGPAEGLDCAPFSPTRRT